MMHVRNLWIAMLSLSTPLLAQTANLSPSVHAKPFHLTNFSTEVAHKSGSGTAFVNFTASYHDSLNGHRVLLKDHQADSLLIRLDLDSALNIKSTSLDTDAVVGLGLQFDHVRHATSFYLSASAFTVLENFVDSTVLTFEAFFSDGNDDTVFVDSLRLSQDIRNARFFSSNGLSTPVNVPSNPNVRSLTAPGSTTSMDLMRIPLDSAFVRFGLDSVRFTVPRLRTVFITPGGVISVDGGIRIYGLSVATKFGLTTTYFSQGGAAWKDSLLNNVAGKKMKDLGCAVTSSAMLMSSLGIKALDGTDLTPLKLLQWLNLNNGFRGTSANLNWGAIGNFSKASYDSNGSAQPQINLSRLKSTSIDSIEKYLSHGIPVITRVRSRRPTGREHFVLAHGIGVGVDTVGQDSIRGTYLVADPGWAKPTLMSFLANADSTPTAANRPNRFISAQLYTVSRFGHPNHEWVQISVHSPAELVVRDPLGRRTGFDPVNNLTFDEIPTAEYASEGGIDDIVNGTESIDGIKSVFVRQPVSGNYMVKVIGTGTGAYEVSMSKSNRLGTSISKLPSVFGSTFPGKIDSGIVNFPTVTIPTWRLKLNGVEDSLAISQGDTLRLTVDIDPGSNEGQSVDIRLFVKNAAGQTYYLSLSSTWGTQNVPTFSGLLPEVTNYLVTSINTQTVATGLYTFYFEIDYDDDGIAEQVDTAKVFIE